MKRIYLSPWLAIMAVVYAQKLFKESEAQKRI